MDRLAIIGCCCAAALLTTNPAHAKPLEAFWQEVPIVDDPTDSSDLTGFRSFELFIQMEPGDYVTIMDVGIASNVGLSLGAGQDFFQHDFGTDKSVHPDFHSFWPDVEYDSRFQMGTAAHDEYQTFLNVDWDPTGLVGVFSGLHIPGVDDSEFTFADSNDHYWFGRFTVNSAGMFGENTSDLGEFLGGQLYMFGDGPNGEFGQSSSITGVVDIPNAFAIPTPGASAILAGLALTTLRRRR